MPADYDLLVIGGGITGLSTAVHAARRGLRTVLVEAAPELGGVSTQRSGALVRTHYEDAASARLALRGLELFESFTERYGGPSGFTSTGFAYVPTADEVTSGALADRTRTLQSVGVETRLVDADELRGIDPSIDVSDVGVVAYEPRSGFADPAQTCATLAHAATEAGAELRPSTAALRLLVDGSGTVTGAEVRSAATDAAEMLEAEQVVLCSGAWSVALAAAAGVDLPIRPTAVKLGFVRRSGPMHLIVIDAVNGIYLRPDPAGRTLVGRRTWTDEPLSGPDADLPEVDDAFLTDTSERLARRLPRFRGQPVVDTRAGMLDMTPDALPLVGPALDRSGDAVPGLWLNCGWSGTGFKTGTAVGEALVDLIATGRSPLDLSSYTTSRPFPQSAEPVRSPH
ncbi:MAG: FAD-binding oxidoreductase [Solirubrobacteraceae bacterium]|nr:FAD-binding oxidoreductase [Solirubrobacteraceae bacterium]